MDWIVRRAFHNFRGIQLRYGCWGNHLELAGDIVIQGEEPATVQPILDRIICEAMIVSLGVNTKNEVLDNFTRLATLYQHQWRYFSTDASLQIPGLYCRVDFLGRDFLSLRKALWSRSEISLRAKLRIYRADVHLVFTCARKTGPLRVDDRKTARKFQPLVPPLYGKNQVAR